MQKTMKRIVALILAVMLCVSMMPYSAVAVEAAPVPAVTEQAEDIVPEPEQEPVIVPSPEPDGTAPPAAEESSVPDVTASPEQSGELTDEPTAEPSAEPAPEASADPSALPTVEPTATPAPASDERSLDGVEVTQVWPTSTVRRAAARAASVGAQGVLEVGYNCFKSEVGTLPTLGFYIEFFPAKTLKVSGQSVAAYCLDMHMGVEIGASYTWTDLTKSQQDLVGTILALGFHWSSSTYWDGPSDNGDKWAVTQIMVWAAREGYITMNSDGTYNVSSAVDADIEKAAPHAYNPSGFRSFYQQMKQGIVDYFKIPSFASQSASSAETITLRWDGSKYTATVTDSNNILDNYSFDNSIPGVQISASGNKLTLSTTEAITNPKTSSRVDSDSNLSGGKGAVAVWRTSDTSLQDFATYNAAGGEPVGCYIKVKTDAVGSAGLKKTAEDGKVSGIQFRITGSDGSSVTRTTDANGNIDIDGLPIYDASGSKITYTATEINVPNRYVTPQSKTFQLSEGQTASVTMENKLKQWRVTVTKSDSKTGATPQGNAKLQGAKYGVYQGNTLVKEYTIGADRTFTTDYYPYGVRP